MATPAKCMLPKRKPTCANNANEFVTERHRPSTFVVKLGVYAVIWNPETFRLAVSREVSCRNQRHRTFLDPKTSIT